MFARYDRMAKTPTRIGREIAISVKQKENENKYGSNKQLHYKRFSPNHHKLKQEPWGYEKRK